MTTICISQVSIQGQWESLQFLTYDCAKNCWIPSCPWGDPYSQSKIQIGINHNIHTPALLLRTLKEAPFWNMLVLYGYCPNSFRAPPPFCQTGKCGKKSVRNHPGKPLHPPSPPFQAMPIWKQHILKRGFPWQKKVWNVMWNVELNDGWRNIVIIQHVCFQHSDPGLYWLTDTNWP